VPLPPPGPWFGGQTSIAMGYAVISTPLVTFYMEKHE
jgi:hypothetical protein